MRLLAASSPRRSRLLAVALSASLSVAVLPAVAAQRASATSRTTAAATGDKDPAERPDRVSAMVTARAQTRRIEDLSQRTESTQVFANPDGSWTAEQADGPVRTEQGDGTWENIDSALQSSDGGFAPKNTTTDLVISGGGDKTFATMTEDGKALQFKWPTVLPAPVVDGDTATFRDAVENGDLVVTATATGFSHDIVLRRAPADPVTFAIPVATSGAKLSEDAQGDLSITGTSGTDIVTADQPLMYDSSKNVAGDPEHIAAVGATVTAAVGGGTLTLNPDQSFLADPATQYPVTIDPTYTNTAYSDTFVQSAVYTSGQGGNTELRAGSYDDGSTKTRSYIAFGFGPWEWQPISNATLTMYNWNSPTCSGSAVRVARLTAGWSSDTLSWANQPSASGPTAETTTAKGYSASCAAGDISWNVTPIVTGWANHTYDKLGFRLAGATETNSAEYRKFRSLEYSVAAQRPRLSVTYNADPSTASLPTVTSQTFDGTQYVGKAQPSWTSTANDDGASIYLVTEARTSTTATSVASQCQTPSVVPGTPASCTFTTALANNSTYVVRSHAWDGQDWGPWSGWRTIKTDLTVPTLPSLSCTNVADGQWYESPPTVSTTCTYAGNGAYVDYQLNGQSKGTLGSSGSFSAQITSTGYTNIEVRSHTRGAQVSAWKSVAFGTGPASILSPVDGDRSSSTFPVEAAAPSGATSANVQWRFAPTTSGTPDPEAGWTDADNVRLASTSNPVWSGSVSDTSMSATPKLVWTPGSETGIGGTALVEVRVKFAYTGSVTKVSPLRRVTVVPHAFGGSFPTASAGPGQVALFTGEFQMSESDLSVPGYGGDLTLGRSHTSLAGAPAGPAGIFGPGWTADLSGPDEGEAGLNIIDRTAQDGSIVLASPEGDAYTYRHTSGTTGAQRPGTYDGVGENALNDDRLTLATVSEPGMSHRLTLTESDGTTTTWVRNTAKTPVTWVVEQVESPADQSTTTYAHDGDGQVRWIFAPAPAGTSCDSITQTAGCRALHLNYTDITVGAGTETRLTSVDLRIWNPKTGADGLPGAGAGMDTITVAKYSYNTSGQLSDTWDPSIADAASALKTSYTYNNIAGHTVLKTVTEPGVKTWTFAYDNTARLSTIVRPQDAAVGGTDATWTVRYDLPLSGGGLPDLTQAAAATWGQPAADTPTASAAVWGPDRTPAASPSADDYEYASLSYWTKSGRTTNNGSYGANAWQINSTRYDALGNTVWSLDAASRRQALTEGSTTEETAGAADKYATLNVYNAAGTRLEETWGPTRDFLLENGTAMTGRTLTQTVYDGEPDAAGLMNGRPTTGVPVGGYDLPVKTLSSATDKTGPGAGGNLFDTKQTLYRYDPVQAGDGDGWTLRTPTRVSTQDGGGWSTTITRFDTEGKITQTQTPQAVASTGSAAAARTKDTVYYTPSTGASRAECRNKPEWAGLVCWHGPDGTPSSGAPVPDLATPGYSTLLTQTRTVESSGGAARTNITKYDTAGRLVTSSLATSGLAAADRAVAGTTTLYSPTTGLPTSVSNGTQTISTGYDTWGRVTSQTDGTGNTATTAYDAAGRVARANDGKGTYTYSYNGTDSQGRKERRGLVTSLDVGLPNGSDVFTGSYDSNGALVEQKYPGGIIATWTRDLDGAPLSLNYTQSGTGLLGFSQDLDRHGRVRINQGQASTQTYDYDDRNRLANVEDTTEIGCTSRAYGFSKDSNRTNLATYNPDSDGTCQSNTAATTVAPTFDDADRITTAGYSYDNLGRTKTVPAADAPSAGLAGQGNLTVGYSANDMVATLSQSGTDSGVSVAKSQDFILDAADRVSTIKTLTGNNSLNEDTNHYDSSDDNPSWTETKERPNTATAWTTTWSRNITALDSGLSLIQTSSGTAQVQLANLHGDITGQVTIGNTGMDSYSEMTEYGAARTPTTQPARYGWLGAEQRHSTGILGGLALMGARLYNAKSGRFLSRDPIEGGGDTAYTYPPDPVNELDLDGKCYSFICTNPDDGKPRFGNVKLSSAEIGRRGEAKAYKEIRRWYRQVYVGYNWKLEIHPTHVDVGNDGVREPDLALWVNGRIVHYIEVKANGSRYRSLQRRKDRYILREYGIPTLVYRVQVKATKFQCVAHCNRYLS